MQLAAEEKYRGAGIAGERRDERTPVVDVEDVMLWHWTLVLEAMDARMADFVASTKHTCGFQWVRCDDLSRHLCVWQGGNEYVLSLEPRQGGLIDVLIGLVKTTEFGSVRMVIDASCFRVACCQNPLEAWSRFGKTLEDWIGNLPSEVWIAALYDRLPTVANAYGRSSRAGLAVSHVFRAFGATEKNAEHIECTHEEFALLVKFAAAFASPLPPESPLRAAIRGLRDAMIQAMTTGPVFPTPYEGGLL
jgi:hypothetical protein